MVIYNARTLQKWLTFITGGFFELSSIVVFLIGEFKNEQEMIAMLSIIVGTFLMTFIVYFLLIKFANYVFIFDEAGFVRKINNRIVLKVKWEDVRDIGTYQMYDFFHFEWGPLFLGIDYYDANHNKKTLQVAFSSKDAKRLKMSQLNEKLYRIRY